MPTDNRVDVVRLTHAGRHFVALASGLDVVTSVASSSAADNNLDRHLFGAVSADTHRAHRALMVPTRSGPAILRTALAIELDQLDCSAFIQLPKLMRATGCRPWVCGFAELTSPDGPAAPTLGVWIDLQTLAEELAGDNSSSTNPED